MAVKKEGLAALGFRRPDKEVPRRLIMSIEGLDKTGKTTFALTAPKPLVVINTDFGHEGVMERFADQDVWVLDLPCASELLQEGDTGAYDEAWRKFVEGYNAAMKHARTIVWDTATELWELARLKYHGKLTQVKPHNYTEVNMVFRQLIKDAYDNKSLNLIMIHKVKEEYINDKFTGKMVRSGFKDTPYLVQILAQTWRRDPADFGLTILTCRQNPSIIGLELEGDFCTFDALLDMVFGSDNRG